MTGAPPSDCALLIASCDAYSDLWRPFFELLRRHWPDCPFPIYLGTGELAPPIPGVTSLRSTGGKDWSLCLQEHLMQIREPWVLLMLDDFFLRRDVTTAAILTSLDFAQRHRAISVRLVPRPPPTTPLPGNSPFGECAPGSDYRLNTQAAIWHRTGLLALLRPGESIWEFERNGNERALSQLQGFYCARHSVLPYAGVFAHHVVEKGRWFPHEKWIFSRANIGCDFSRRSTLSWTSTAMYQGAHLFHRLLLLLPWRQRQATLDHLKNCLPLPLRRVLAKHGVVDARAGRRTSAIKSH